MQWFRWYRGTSEDAKFRQVARYGSVTVRDVLAVWAVLLEDASEPDHRGICTRDEDFIAAVLDLEPEQAQMILEGMQVARLIDVGAGEISIKRWKERQFECDVSDPTAAQRMRRYRERKREKTARYGSVTPQIRPDSDTDSESESESPPKSPPLGGEEQRPLNGQGKPSKNDLEPYREIWNEVCASAGLPSCRELNEPRRKSLNARLKEPLFSEDPIERWRTYCRKIVHDVGPDPGWSMGKPNIDWALKPSTPAKVHEGAYGKPETKKPPPAWSTL